MIHKYVIESATARAYPVTEGGREKRERACVCMIGLVDVCVRGRERKRECVCMSVHI